MTWPASMPYPSCSPALVPDDDVAQHPLGVGVGDVAGLYAAHERDELAEFAACGVRAGLAVHVRGALPLARGEVEQHVAPSGGGGVLLAAWSPIRSRGHETG